jgi:hypothetical protein
MVQVEQYMLELRAEVASLTRMNHGLLYFLERDNPSWSETDLEVRASSATRFDFDETLARSSAYRGSRIDVTAAQGSMITRSTNRTSWTELSGRSLAQVENVADILLPIYYDDIESSSQRFGFVETIEKETETDIIDYENWRQPQPRFLNFVSEDQYNQTRDWYPIPQKRISISLLGWTATGKSELLSRTKFAFSAPLEIFVTSILSF